MKPGIFLAFAATLNAAQASEDHSFYNCDNGSQIEISFATNEEGSPQALLHFADSTITLPKVATASGELYRMPPVSLQIQGDEALFIDGAGNQRHCTRGMAMASNSILQINGQITYRHRIALHKTAVLRLRIQTIENPGVKPLTLSEQDYALNGAQPPITYNATVDRDLIGNSKRLRIIAQLQSGKMGLHGQGEYIVGNTLETPPIMLTPRTKPTPTMPR